MFDFIFQKLYGFDTNAKRAANLFTDEEHKPVFVSIESHLCPFCYNFKAVREEIYEFIKSTKKMDIARISTDLNPELTKQFPGTGTPRVFITTSNIQNAILYEGPRTYEELKKFVQQFIQPPVLQIKNKNHLNTELQTNINSSIFLFHEKKITEASNLFERLANEFIDFPCEFFNLTYGQFDSSIDNETTLSAYFSPTKQIIHYTGSFHEESMRKFVYDHLYPPFSVGSQYFLALEKKKNEGFLILSNPKHNFVQTMKEITPKFPVPLKTIILDCHEHFRFCQANDIDPYKEKVLKYVNSRQQIYYDYHGTFSADDILEWVNKTIEGEEPQQGPGSGVTGIVRREVIPFMTNENIWLKYIFPMSLCGLAGYLCVQMYKLFLVKRIKID